MRRWTFPFVAGFVVALLGAAAPPGGCDQVSQDLGDTGDAGGAAVGPYGSVCCGATGSCADGLPCCVAEGGACDGDYECCGGLCSGANPDGIVANNAGTCVSSGITACVASLGSRCTSATTCGCTSDDDCCQENSGAVCAASTVTTAGKRCCLATGIPCGGGGDCCSGSCDATSEACD